MSKWIPIPAFADEALPLGDNFILVDGCRGPLKSETLERPSAKRDESRSTFGYPWVLDGPGFDPQCAMPGCK